MSGSLLFQYKPDLSSFISLSKDKKVHYINHSKQLWQAKSNAPQKAAIEYLNTFSKTYNIPVEQLTNLQQKVNYLEPRAEGLSYRLTKEKSFFDSVTYAYTQTSLNVPIWRAGVSVTIKQNPARVVMSANSSHDKVQVELPEQKVIDDYKDVFVSIGQCVKQTTKKGGKATETFESATFINKVFGQPEVSAAEKKHQGQDAKQQTRLNRGRFYVYKYDAQERVHQPENDTPVIFEDQNTDIHPVLPLPDVAESIKDGEYYLVAELLFSYYLTPFGMLNWRALVELQTGSVLYLRALIDGVNGMVFEFDPITKSGDLGNTADQSNAVLNPLRNDLVLNNLDAPVAGVQSLSGSYVRVRDDDSPAIAPPTQLAGNDFDYDVRTNNFAAVSAYYHANSVFELIEDLGFSISSYFDGTTFPVIVDHRASLSVSTGIEANAYCAGDGEGNGIGLVGYMLSDLTDTANPLGRAVDKYVHWHEIGGHGILWDHVESPNFGFAHSAGDVLAALQSDPYSQIRDQVERFRYAPFRPLRWMNRDVSSGFAWGGLNDTGGYGSEEILATTLFRVYQSIGGDSDNEGRRVFASRMMSYLILRAVSTLDPDNNPSDALGFCNALKGTDLLNWVSEGIDGGAYNKVIHWSFEKQGLFQPAGAATPVTTAGAPPEFDVYIDDGRAGEYDYQAVHWNTTTIWNRNDSDGLTDHESAIEGVTNYAYVKVKNRGTSVANNVVVKGYHSLPGAGLTWPTDFQPMQPATGLNVASIAANNGEEITFGPFEWVPNENMYGHDCMLMIVTADGDPSNIDHFIIGEAVAEWRLVPNDNNVGQRNVNLVPGGDGERGLMAGLHEHVFYAGNPSHRAADMQLDVKLPDVLLKHGWQLDFANVATNFVLQPGERRKVVIKLTPGTNFTPDEVRSVANRDMVVQLFANDNLLGGMTYRLDPDIRLPASRQDSDSGKCKDKAKDLLNCLNIDNQDVKKVCVKKVSIDIELDNDCDCS